MYSTCLFCHADLGRNEAIEPFPVGRRLAFDPAKGRLWVVCRGCERWNLTPLEERWEAIEECERRFRATRLRVSTDHVGLARLADGTELVRIGEPTRPEMAAWRYGDQFGRRRRRYLAYTAGAVVAGGAAVVAGPVLGLVSLGAVSPLLNLFNLARNMHRSSRVLRVPSPGDDPILVPPDRLPFAQLLPAASDGWRLRVLAVETDPAVPWWRLRHESEPRTHELTGPAALRAAAVLLPHFNAQGARATQVREAVGLLEEAGSPEGVFGAVARETQRRFRASSWQFGEEGLLRRIPRTMRLALEMAAHEESERRALAGELAELERAWREAEEIAAIADDLLLPDGIRARVERRR